MKKITVQFTRADAENCRYRGDDLETSGIDQGDGARVHVRISEADAQWVAENTTGGRTAVLPVDPRMVSDRTAARRAVIQRSNGRPEPDQVAAYLWANFTIVSADDQTIVITGHDNAGFTLEALCDRLWSGIICARVVR
jgi:hypothetical protein